MQLSEMHETGRVKKNVILSSHETQSRHLHYWIELFEDQSQRKDRKYVGKRVGLKIKSPTCVITMNLYYQTMVRVIFVDSAKSLWFLKDF